MVSHVQTWDGEYTGYKMLNMEHPGRRTRGRPQGSFMNVMKEEIYMGGMTGCCGILKVSL